VIVLYDKDCGLCRWLMAWAIEHDDRKQLVAVAIQSPLGAELLADLAAGERLRSAHLVTDDGLRRSGGAAAADVLAMLPKTRLLGRLAHGLPRTTALLYGFVAARRQGFGRFVGKDARRRADALLEASSAATAAELEARSRTSAGSV
jgi:predicted DCC family thiol-disulfide oxidoreductase YuxK